MTINGDTPFDFAVAFIAIWAIITLHVNNTFLTVVKAEWFHTKDLKNGSGFNLIDNQHEVRTTKHITGQPGVSVM